MDKKKVMQKKAILNILFVSDEDICPLSGGIERVVFSTATYFKAKYRSNCYLAYGNGDENDTNSPFESRLSLSKSSEQEIFDFCASNKIDIVYSNILKAANIKTFLPIFRKITDRMEIPHWALYHNMPGYELVACDEKFLFYQILHGKFKSKYLSQLLKQGFIKLAGKNLCTSIIRSKYLCFYENVDKLLLLDPSYEKKFRDIIGLKSHESKFDFLPNALSFKDSIQQFQIGRKEKIVLVVSRLEEKQKRISLVLEVWKRVCELCNNLDWNLVIVGSGPDEDYYKKKCLNYKLKNVSFEGNQDPYHYYEKSSIFLMTSSYEGFPMVLVEAQQMGVVPIAFKSFDAIETIIHSGVNGIVVKDTNSVDAYCKRLIELMSDEAKRQKMAHSALTSSEHFSMSSVMETLKVKMDNSISQRIKQNI